MPSSIETVVSEAIAASSDASGPLTSIAVSEVLLGPEITVPADLDEIEIVETIDDAPPHPSSLATPPTSYLQPPWDPVLVKSMQEAASALSRSALSLRQILSPLTDPSKYRSHWMKPSWSKSPNREEALKSLALVDDLAKRIERYTGEVDVWAFPGMILETDCRSLRKSRRDVDKVLSVFKNTVTNRVIPKSAVTDVQAFNAEYADILRPAPDEAETEGDQAITETGSAAAARCPLEQFMAVSRQLHSTSYKLAGFVDWASWELADSRLNNVVGPMKSAHLFRSRAWPFYHEFALICFGGGEAGSVESWIRVERAARQKAARSIPLPQADSLGPLFRGVPLRESLSLGVQKRDLSENADELASVTINYASLRPSSEPHAKNGPDVEGHLHLAEIADQLAETSRADPLYQLFSANCRWFARRTILSIAQRLGALGVVHSITWTKPKSSAPSLINLDTLSKNLLDDPFGGRQLLGARGDRAREIRASGLLNLARTSLFNIRAAEGITPGSEALRILDEIQKPNRAQLDLMYHACWYTGAALMRSGQVGDALLLLERARGLVMSALIPLDMGDKRLIEESYAECLSRVGRHDEAIAIREHFIAAIRQCFEDNGESPAMFNMLASALFGHANHLLHLGRLQLALKHAQELVGIKRRLAAYRPDLHNRSFGSSLWLLASVLLELGPDHYATAHAAALDALKHTREVYARYPDTTRSNLAAQLNTFCRTLRVLGRPPTELEAINEERSGHLEKLYHSDPVFYARDYRSVLASWAADLRASGRFREAANVSVRAIGVRDDVLEDPSKRYDTRYRSTLHRATMVIFGAEDPRSLAAAEEELVVIRDYPEGSEEREDVTTEPKDIRRLLDLAMIRMLPYHSDPDWSQKALELGYRAALLAISLCERPVWNQPLLLAECHSTLSDCQASLHRPREALSAILPALRICAQVAPASEQNSKLLGQVIDRCNRALHFIADSTVDPSDDSVLLDSRSALDLWRTLLQLCPTSFARQDFSDALWRHANWVAGTIHEAEDTHYFDDAISFARDLCASSPPVEHGPYSYGLLRALHAHAIFLWRDPPENRVLALLAEAYAILPHLSHLDRKELAEVSDNIASSYVAALHAAHRYAEAASVSAYAVQSSQTLHSLDPSAENTSSLARHLYSHAGVLDKAQQFDLAHETSVQAIALARELYALDADKYRDQLIAGLNNFSNVLASLDRRVDSMSAAIEALTHIRTIRLGNLTSTLDPTLRNVLLNRVAMFGDADPDTLISRRGSLVFAEAFYDDNPKQFGRRVSDRYHKLELKLAEEGETAEAISVGESAVEWCRGLLASAPDANGEEPQTEGLLYDLARALDTLAVDMLNMGRTVDVIAILEDCVATNRALFLLNPSHHRLGLARALHLHSSALVILSRAEEALPLSQEGLKLSRAEHAARTEDESIIHELADVLAGHAKLLFKLLNYAEAQLVLEEVIGLWKSLAERTGADVLPSLAPLMEMHAKTAWVRGHHWRAFSLSEEATVLRRAMLARDEPNTRWREALVECLLQHAAIAEELGTDDVVSSSTSEAILLTQASYALQPEVYTEKLLVRQLSHAAWCEKKGEREEDVVRIIADALPLLRSIVAHDPENRTSRLASTLQSQFAALCYLGREVEALTPLAELIPLLKSLVEKDAETYGDDLTVCVEVFNAIVDSEGGAEKFTQHKKVDWLAQTGAEAVVDAMEKLEISPSEYIPVTSCSCAL